MNKINPLYVLALFITLLLISFVQLNNTKKELVKNTNEFNHFKEDVLKYKSLKKVWKNKDVQKLVSSISKLDSSIETKEYKRKIILSLNSSKHNLPRVYKTSSHRNTPSKR